MLESLLLSVQVSTIQGAECPAPPRTPSEFAAAMATIQEGDPSSRVLQVLGWPDDVRTPDDLDGLRWCWAKELWCYGADTHLAFPTLGQILIQENDTVAWTIGGAAAPPAPDILSEEERVAAVRLVAEFPACIWQHGRLRYNPTTAVRIANHLRSMGKEKALAAIEEFLRLAPADHPARDGGFILPIVLFDVPADAPERPRCCLLWEELRTEFPLYPIVLIGDLPMCLWPLGGYGIGGGLPNPASQLQYWRDHGVLRPLPLRPAAQPVAEVQRCLDERLGVLAEPERKAATNLIVNQLVAALDTVYRDAVAERAGPCPPCGEVDQIEAERWTRCLSSMRDVPLVWDESQGCYTLADGSTLAPRSLPTSRRTWKLPLSDRSVRLSVERIDADHVNIALGSDVPENAPVLAGMRLFFDGVLDAGGTGIALDLDCEPGASCGSGLECVKLPMGQELVVHFTRDGVRHEWRHVP